MIKGTVGQVLEYKNGVRDGRYLLDDEYTESPAQLTAIRIEKLLDEHRSPFQHIAIYDTTFHGKMLVIDGFIQLTMADYFCYHEMIVHVPMAVLPTEPKSALVVGGGDGAAVNELCKYESLERVVWIDIDAMVVEICRKHLPELYEFHDRRVEFIATNGAEIDYENEFDIIVIDGTDYIGDGACLASEKFYKALSNALKKNGIITALGWWAWPDPQYHLFTKKLAQANFKNAHYYWFIDPSMKYGHMGVMLMTNCTLDPTTPTYCDRVPTQLTRYYNTAIHTAAFAQPTCFAVEEGFVPIDKS